MELERSLERGSVPDHQAPDLERHREPLVRIERHGVGQLEPGQRRAAALGQRGERAVRAVDVEPQAAFPADRGDRGQVVDRAGVRRPRVREHEKWQATGAASASPRQRGRRAASGIVRRVASRGSDPGGTRDVGAARASDECVWSLA